VIHLSRGATDTQTGTRLSWWGAIGDEFPQAPTVAAYAVDGGPSVAFALRGIPENAPSAYFQKFFETPILLPGPHRLIVVYQGNSQTSPLILTHLLIEGGNFTSPLPGDPSIFTTASEPSSATTRPVASETVTETHSSVPKEDGSKAPIGAIVGGVIGGLAIIAVTILVALFLNRRRKSRARAKTGTTPFDHGLDEDATGNHLNSTPIYATPHNQQMSFQGLPPSHAHGPMPTGLADRWTYDPPISQMAAGSPPHNLTQDHYPSRPHAQPSPPLPRDGANTSPGGPSAAATGFGQPLRKDQIVTLGANEPSPVVLHEDSGVRVDAQGNMTELPPLYTIH
jgi:hypothetical protein